MQHWAKEIRASLRRLLQFRGSKRETSFRRILAPRERAGAGGTDTIITRAFNEIAFTGASSTHSPGLSDAGAAGAIAAAAFCGGAGFGLYKVTNAPPSAASKMPRKNWGLMLPHPPAGG